MILTYTQIRALNILNDGGKIFLFDNGSVGLDTYNGDTYKFRKTTFNILKKAGYIEHKYSPALGTQVWGITDSGCASL